MKQVATGVIRLARACVLILSAGKWRVFWLLALTAAAGLVPVVSVWSVKLLIDTLTGHGPASQAAVAGAVIVSATLATAVVPLMTRFLSEVLRREVGETMQERLFTAVNALPGLHAFEEPSFHDRLRLADQAGQTAPGQMVRGGIQVIQQAVTAAGYVSALAVIDVRVCIIASAAAVPAVWAEFRIDRMQNDLLWNLSPAERRRFFYSSVQTDVRAAKEVRLFGIGGFLCGRMLRELRDIHRAERHTDRRVFVTQAVLSLLAAGGMSAAIVLMVTAARSGRLTAGDVSLVLVGLAGLQLALASMVQQLSQAHRGLMLLRHYEEILAVGAAGCRPGLITDVGPLGGMLEFEDVWFRYDENADWVLRGVNLALRAGEATAIVGLNGAGKSTIVKLLCGFYEPDRGRILWDGVDIRTFDMTALRNRIGAVFQDFMIYDLSARENIGLGNLPLLADLGAIRAAAGVAGVDDVLMRLPAGYETMLTRLFTAGQGSAEPAAETGVYLSGGQWQRIAVARGLVRKDRDLLILDEPSAGLDPEAEHAIQRALTQLRTGRTTLLISHRLSTVRDADRIVVLEAGKVAEEGTHQELLALLGRYAALFRLQASGYTEEFFLASAPAGTRASGGGP